MPENYDPYEGLHLRVLEEIDPEYNVLVARCLETGTTVTADKPARLRSLIGEALQLHIKLAAEAKNPEALYHRQAPPDVWVRYDAARCCGETEQVMLEIEMDSSDVPKRGVKSELSIVSRLDRQTA